MDKLKFLTLDSNFLSGPIPDSFADLDDLRVLTLHNNENINGTIPTFVEDLRDMQLLSLFNTGLTGTIPTELGRMDDLRNLFLHNTELSGTMPQEICDLRSFDENDGKRLVQLTADCSGPTPKVVCPQPSCCTACF